MIRVLYIKHDWSPGKNYGGDARSLLDLIKSVEGEVEPYVLFSDEGLAHEAFVKNGIRCFIHPFTDIKESFHGKMHLLFHPWRSHFGKWIRYDLPCVLFVRNLIKEEKIDLVHTNTYETTLGWTIQHLLGVKHIWHIREYADSTHTREIIGGRKRLVRKINSADARIVSSKTCLDFWNFKKEDSYAILDAVRSKNNCCYEKNKQPYILFCSNWLTMGKDPLKAVRSFVMSGLAKEGIHLRFVGNIRDTLYQEVMSYAQKHDCAESICFLPYQMDINQQFIYAMAFLQPSMNEGMGRTVAEAMFFGCPVVAHASGGTLDLIKHGETGWLFNSEEECAELLRLVCTTDQESLILKAQDFARTNLSIENYGTKILKVYNSVLRAD